jgi:hypothetical protein
MATLLAIEYSGTIAFPCAEGTKVIVKNTKEKGIIKQYYGLINGEHTYEVQFDTRSARIAANDLTKSGK